MKKPIRVIAAILILAFVGPIPAEAAAQESVIKRIEEREAAEAKKKADEAAAKAAAESLKKGPPKDVPDGWSPFLSVGSTVQIGSSSGVVGKIDGQTYSLGVNVNGRMGYKKGQHEWNNKLSVQLQESNIPGLTGWVKSLDTTRLDSSYVWSPSANFGLFASFNIDTSFFGTEDVRPGPTSYLIKEPGAVITNGVCVGCTGDTGGSARNGGGIKQVLLTKEFAPTTFGQGLGANMKVYEHYGQKVVARVGIGAQEVIARGGVALTDDAATANVIEATRLQDFTQIGAQLKLTADGSFNKNITYGFLADVLFPFYNSLDTGKSFINTVNVSLDLKVGFKMASWFSIEYVLGVRRLPLLVDNWQVWHGLLGSFAFNLIGG